MAKAKRAISVDDLEEYIEMKLIDKINDIDDMIAEEFEIDCWDTCLDGKDWNATLRTMAKMYVKAIISDREDKTNTYKITVDLSKHLKRMELERKIRTMKRELEELA